MVKKANRTCLSRVGHRIKLQGGDEYDALTPAKKYTIWKPGQRKRIKKRYNKRLRKFLKHDNLQA